MTCQSQQYLNCQAWATHPFHIEAKITHGSDCSVSLDRAVCTCGLSAIRIEQIQIPPHAGSDNDPVSEQTLSRRQIRSRNTTLDMPFG